jgi:alpha-D-xyloside xylohydrolase
MNYKGKNLELMQQNMVDIIPFLVSSKNYGILWENYSISRFGDPRDYQHLNTLKLYNENDSLGGLTAEYFVDSIPSKPFLKRAEPKIDYEFREKELKWPKDLQRNGGTVVWTGSMASEFTGIHKFLLYSSCYTKLWLDGKLMVDNWKQVWLPGTDPMDFYMEKDKKYPVKIEWTADNFAVGPYIAFKWLSPVEEKEQNDLSLSSEVADQIDYYYVDGENLDSVISGYRDLTGKATLMPKWAMGLWQSRERYKTREELLDVVKEFRKRKIPLDNIVLDWRYWKQDQWGSHEFDSTRFPDPVGMINELHNKYNTRIMISVWPKFYQGINNYKAFDEKGWLYKRNIDMGATDGISVYTFYDAFNPDARKLFWRQMDSLLFKKGIDAWWMDATEPEIYSNISNKEKTLRMNPTALGPGARYMNAFTLVNSQGVYEGQRQANPDQRVFILTRSAFAGQQRYAAATWSGDLASRWDDLENQIPAGLNFSLSGIPYWTTDIGGFSVEKRFSDVDGNDEEWREFMTRWFQFGTFCPLFRVHGQYPYREIFNVAPENHIAYKTMVKFDKLRYRLMPYIYSLAGHAYFDNSTIMRALVMDFGTDKKVLNIGNQYMFGPALLVCPVYQYKARERELYLPENTGWYNLFTGKYNAGGNTIKADAPLDIIPIFVKEGSILPIGPEIQFAMEKPADPITLFVYTGKDGQFTLYEDENVNYNYEKGIYAQIPMHYNEAGKSLVIGKREGSFPGMIRERTFQVVWINKDKAVPLDFNRKPNTIIKYTGQEQTIKMN